MQTPVRLTLLLRPSVSVGILLAVGFSTFVLGATPFLFNLLAEHYGLGLSVVSLVGVFQLGGFVLGSWGSGHWLTPRRRVFIAALALSVGANLASALLPAFPVLVALRFLSGLSLGLISWFAWVQVFGDEQGMGDVAVIGPVAGIVSSPVIALFATRGGAGSVFALLGTIGVVPLLFNRGSGAADRIVERRDRSSPVPIARILLVCLGLFTLGGSATFQFAVVLGVDRLGITASTTAIVFSANALAAIPSARWPWKRGIPGPWLALTGICAVTMTIAPSSYVFAAAIILWGFAFWMAIPGVFKVLADRSAHPADRAGDAQAVMAAGRVVGPFIGGAILDNLGSAYLGAIGGGLMIGVGVVVFALRTFTSGRLVEASA